MAKRTVIKQDVLDTAKIAATLAEATALINRDHTERLIKIATAMEAHIVADSQAFSTLAAQTYEINQDIKSLIGTRSFTYGVWKTLTVIGVVSVGLTTLIMFIAPFVQKLFN